MNTRVCMQCGNIIYSQGITRRKLCDDCKRKNRLEYQQALKSLRLYNDKNSFKTQSLEEIVKEIDIYNKTNNTCLTYGEYVSKRFLGQL